MKIANILINSEQKSENDHSSERDFIDYALYLTKRNAQVLSVFECNKSYREATIEASSSVLELSSKKFHNFLTLFQSWLKFIEFSPQVVLSHSSKALLFARSARIFTKKTFAIISICKDNPEKFIKSDFIIVRSASLVKNLLDLGFKRENIFVVNNSIEIEENFQPTQKLAFSKPVKIGSIGLINQDKNFDKVLRAMVVLRSRGIECEYKIIGSGDSEDNLNMLALELRLEKNFKILGWDADKKNFFSDIDICVMPIGQNSSSDYVLEAMLYLTPVIASNSWALDEIIEHKINAIRINIDDENQIPHLVCDAIEQLINDEAGARQYAKRAYEKVVDHYSSEVVSNRVYQICKNASEVIL